MVVFTGLSGSGKSSLAFDTIFAEGQRRYVESLSSYARMFLGRVDKPDVDFIEGLSPAVSIDQKSTSRNPRSTVGTITEIYDYMRLLWDRIGRAHCPVCGEPITRQTPQQIVDQLLELPAVSYTHLDVYKRQADRHPVRLLHGHGHADDHRHRPARDHGGPGRGPDGAVLDLSLIHI